jgi:hypothetical protein
MTAAFPAGVRPLDESWHFFRLVNREAAKESAACHDMNQ